MPPNKSNKGQ